MFILECLAIPIGSMYGIYANIWGILMVNVTIYSIHGMFGHSSKPFSVGPDFFRRSSRSFCGLRSLARLKNGSGRSNHLFDVFPTKNPPFGSGISWLAMLSMFFIGRRPKLRFWHCQCWSCLVHGCENPGPKPDSWPNHITMEPWKTALNWIKHDIL